MSMRMILLASLCALSACAAELSPGGNTGGNTGGNSGSNSGGGGGDSGGGNTGGSNTGGGGMTATQYLTQLDQKFCDEAFACQASFTPQQTGETFADDFGASASECVSDGVAYDMPDVVESEITAGKIHFDPAAAAACVAGIAYASCTTFWADSDTYPASCDTALVGTVADGGACVVDYDCSNLDSICDPTAHTCGADTGSGA